MNKVKNIIISGTNFWNPGDDFVRDGVIAILKNYFHGYTLNFLFYNFNQDFFPQNKFSGIHNMLSKGDLDQCRDFIDEIVIAGLSAGSEIKDLYNWILDNNLERKVILIGAGYENAYVDKHIYEEPELSIFKNARLITGRTAKTPMIIKLLGLPYFYINCPAILSVDKIKNIPENKQIRKIALSVQLPHSGGVSNHSTGQEMYELSLQIILDLYRKGYELGLIAHHKSEYFHFLYVFDKYKLNIPVIFSSFYQDLYRIYPEFDAVVTTRLHSSLFANGFGIPGIVINDTDRHTHTMEGFPHSVWVRSKVEFDYHFSRLSQCDLHQIAAEAEIFKQKLMEKYLKVLNKELTQADQGKNTEKKKDEIIAGLKLLLGRSEIKGNVLTILKKLTPDHWLKNNILNFEKSFKEKETWFDSLVFLNWYAATFKPGNYLEVGVRRGRSMTQVLTVSPGTKAFGFDMWLENYGSLPDKGIFTENPGPDFVIEEAGRCGITNLPVLIRGNSHETLNEYFNNKNNQQYFDLILIDGDHSYEGAKLDLDIAFSHLCEGGAIIFDDINHVAHKELKQLWDSYKVMYPEFIFLEDLYGNGTGIAIKGPFDKYQGIIDESGENEQNEKLPVHFFTIVLNGEPFIEKHINIFSNLPFKWHWHIVEGLASLSHDTAWSLKNGAAISDDLHANGLSNDGTSEYLDRLKAEFPENITVYRKDAGQLWDGKLEMVNAPLKNISFECLLWQIDADEFWSSDQIIKARNMFLKNPQKTAAYYDAKYFVGKDLVITSKNTYGNHRSYEWIRTWRFTPGLKWKTHEPPCLAFESEEGEWCDLAKMNPFLHDETLKYGLVFNHYAYILPKQLTFKEKYYGYKNALQQWNNLNMQKEFPVYLRDYFEWVKDDAVVSRLNEVELSSSFTSDLNNERLKPEGRSDKNTQAEIEEKIINQNYSEAETLLLEILRNNPSDIPALNNLSVVAACKGNYKLSSEIIEFISRIDQGNEIAFSNRSFIQAETEIDKTGAGNEIKGEFNNNKNGGIPENPKRIIWMRLDSIGDNVLSASMLPSLRKKYSDAELYVVCQEHIAELYECYPMIKEIIKVPSELKWESENQYYSFIEKIKRISPDLLLNSVYSRHSISDIPGLEFIMHRVSFRNAPSIKYNHIIKSSQNQITELERHNEFLAGLGISDHDLHPEVRLTDEDNRYAEEIYRKSNIDPEKCIVLFPSARVDIKIYPLDHFACALNEAFRDLNYNFVLLGGKEDNGVNEEFMSMLNFHAVNLAGKTSLRQAAAIIKNSKLYIGTDTGAAHMACAVGTPNVVIIGGGHFGRFMPYSNLTTLISLPLECFGCNWVCKYDEIFCIKQINWEVLCEGIKYALKPKNSKPTVFAQSRGSYTAHDSGPDWKMFYDFVDMNKLDLVTVDS